MHSDTDEGSSDIQFSPKCNSSIGYRMKRSALWEHFDLLSKGNSARCKYCGNDLSYRATISNLKSHLIRKHPGVYDDTSKPEAAKGEKVRWKDDALEEIITAVPDKINFSTEIWRRFRHEKNSSRCIECKEYVLQSIEEMKNHLEEHHSKTMDDIIAKVQEDDMDNDRTVAGDDNDIYTEVVYLEEETKPTPKTHKKRRSSDLKTILIKPQVKRERKDSNSSEELVTKSKHKKPLNELNAFVDYVSCLLQKVPAELLPKLQLDVINLIYNAQNLHNASDNTKSDPTSNYVTINKNVSCVPNGANENIMNASNAMSSEATSGTQRLVAVPIQQLYVPSNLVNSANSCVSSSSSSNYVNNTLTPPLVTLPVLRLQSPSANANLTDNCPNTD